MAEPYPATVDPYDADFRFLLGVLPWATEEELRELIPEGGTAAELIDSEELLSLQLTKLRERLGIPNPPDIEDNAPSPDDLRKVAEAAMAKQKRKVGHRVVAACTATGILSTALLVTALTQTGSGEATPTPPAKEPAPTASSTHSPSQRALTLPTYTDAVLHYVSLEGTVPVTANRSREDARTTAAALGALNTAFQGRWNLGLNVSTDPTTHDLTPNGPLLANLCEQQTGELDTEQLSHEIVELVDAKTPLKQDVLDVVIVDVDEDTTCDGIPIAEAVNTPQQPGDIIVYRERKLTESVLAHEIIHLTHYGHDNLDATKVEGDTVSVAPDTGYFPYGNNQTLSGDGARAGKITDKDPLSGSLLLQSGVLTPEQVATIPKATGTELTLHALTADNTTRPLKLVTMPMAGAGGASTLMLELSYEGDNLTLKAYSTEAVMQHGIAYRNTRLIPLSRSGFGLGGDDLDRPIHINFYGEKVTLNLTGLGSGDDATANVTISRA